MVISNVRVNTYVGQVNKCSIDLISKIYGVIAWILGINRLLILFKFGKKYKLLTLAYSLLLNVVIFYFVLKSSTLNFYLKFINFTEYLLCAIFAIINNETLLKFYDGLFDFDIEIKSKRITTSKSVIYCTQATFTLILVVILNIWRQYTERLHNLTELMPAYLNHVWELHYYGHLFSFIKLRLKSVRILLLASFPMNDDLNCCSGCDINFKEENIAALVTNNKKVGVKKLLNLYSKIINIYDFLNTAIQWQLLAILSTTFLAMLGGTYRAALSIINNEYTWPEGFFDVAMFLAMIGPMFTICAFGQGIHDEVMLLQSSLYSRIYKNCFDKKSRSTASSLLALTEVRSLSFSVFRMFDLNISFPFKFFGLLASYLVILLQVKKVTNFEVPTE
nr:gustatory receptor 16 [Papilio glaucus]